MRKGLYTYTHITVPSFLSLSSNPVLKGVALRSAPPFNWQGGSSMHSLTVTSYLHGYAHGGRFLYPKYTHQPLNVHIYINTYVCVCISILYIYIYLQICTHIICMSPHSRKQLEPRLQERAKLIPTARRPVRRAPLLCLLAMMGFGFGF